MHLTLKNGERDVEDGFWHEATAYLLGKTRARAMLYRLQLGMIFGFLAGISVGCLVLLVSR